MNNNLRTFPYEEPVDPSSVGMSPEKLASAVHLFQSQQADGKFPGGQLVVRRHGQVVLNVSTGLAKGYHPDEFISPVCVQPETQFPVYSAGKPLAAIAIAILEERGQLSTHDLITKTIPELSVKGRENITIANVLTHTTGILAPSFQKKYKQAGDRQLMLNLILEAPHLYKPHTFAYMPWEYGIILNEIVHRITGQPLWAFITEEILIPLELPTLRFGLEHRTIDSLARTYWLGKEKYIIAHCNVAENFSTVFNSKEIMEAKNPAFSLITDAANLAAFYEFLLNKGVTRSGKKLLTEESIKRYTTRSILRWNKTLQIVLAFSQGFMLGTRFMPSLYGWLNNGECFGHTGLFSSMGYGDSKTKLAVAIITNGNHSIRDLAFRFIPLNHLIRSSVHH